MKENLSLPSIYLKLKKFRQLDLAIWGYSLCGVAWCGVVCGVVWCVVWYGVVVVWCDVVWW